MFARLQPILAAVAAVTAVLIEAAEFIPFREIWAGALLACAWLWAHQNGWLEWFQRADEVSWRQVLSGIRVRKPAAVRPKKAARQIASRVAVA